MKCQEAIGIVNHIRGTNPVQNTQDSISEALMVANCCRMEGRCDLAQEVLALLVQPECNKKPMRKLIAKLSALVKKEDATTCLVIGPEYSSPLPKQGQDGPSVMVRGWNFGSAMIRWAGSGFKTRSESEIEERLTICQSCPEFENNACKKCGCYCNEKEQLLNKLALASEKCPLGKWQ